MGLSCVDVTRITAEYLVRRCRELGFIPLVSRTPPLDVSFPAQPSASAVYVKLFGHYNYLVNTIHAKWGVLDPENLHTLGKLSAENLSLTVPDTQLLLLSFAEELSIPLSHKTLVQLSSTVATLSEIRSYFSINPCD